MLKIFHELKHSQIFFNDLAVLAELSLTHQTNFFKLLQTHHGDKRACLFQPTPSHTVLLVILPHLNLQAHLSNSLRRCFTP